MRSSALAVIALAAVGRGITDDGDSIKKFPMPELSEYHGASEVRGDAAVKSIGKGRDYVETATELVKTVASGAQFRLVEDHYVGSDGIAHVYFKQTVHGIDIDNADFNVNVDPDGHVFSYGTSFYKGPVPEQNPLSKRRFSDPVDALRGAVSRLGLGVGLEGVRTRTMADDQHFAFDGTKGCVRAPQAKLTYFHRQDTGLSLTWRVETDVMRNWLVSYVDASDSATVHGVVNYVSDLDDSDPDDSDSDDSDSDDSDLDATFKVYPWGVTDPTAGDRKALEDPWNIDASPYTWVGDAGCKEHHTLRGNNAIAQVNISSYLAPNQSSIPLTNKLCTNRDDKGLTEEDLRLPCLYRPQSTDLDFVYPYSPAEPRKEEYRNASVTQLFYTANKYHDLLYVLGFNEEAGNFQANNSGNGGRDNDFVILNAQDGGGINNANFATPPDGQSGRMNMYMWNHSSPLRDGAFDATIVLHEYTHGLSNRLTGGPANAACLNSLESGGMGEGWSDFMAVASLLNTSYTRDSDFPISPWTFNNATGLRAFPYSTHKDRNPLTYEDVNAMGQVHRIGTVWATVLYEVVWNLVDAHGIDDCDVPEFSHKGVPKDGRYLAMKLVMGGMALQPCGPNMVSARDAILDADEALTGGRNKHLLWRGFAKRGLGVKAKYDATHRRGDFGVPDKSDHAKKPDHPKCSTCGS
ncbi:hypothetical protein G6O67_002813 [Ophiocordyceps sinensis]|uniref:Extracellular metalloproteinase n=1 Tax=Ophiocordyceps sinensis TaxID=72228 RepID=A0A8H4PUY3_9HYPO|nr:hypothetical protein G6O67_002813 [Ophiocordyceps sinensis]